MRLEREAEEAGEGLQQHFFAGFLDLIFSACFTVEEIEANLILLLNRKLAD